MDAPTATTTGYALGHASDELQRLAEQADYFGDLTEHVFRQAGLREGMHVLDVGSGAGDVAMLAARIVGPSGWVTGVDVAPEAVATATRRAAEAALTNVTFLQRDLHEFQLDTSVDALVGRLVLMYFPDPAVVLRRLVSVLVPDGIVAFHEFDLTGATSDPRCELFESTLDRLRQAFARAAVDYRTGLKLGTIFEDAGLPAPSMLLGGRVEYGAHAGVYRQVTAVTRTLLPLIVQTRVATPEEIDIETLASRLRAEAVSRGATLVAPPFIGAWTRKPGAP